MSTHTTHTEVSETYFCTITCYKWLPLFEEANAYQSVYNWFDHLKKDGCKILAYVIMPNHLHCLLFPANKKKLLNKLLGEGKTFMAYNIARNLYKQSKYGLLKELTNGVQENEKKIGKKHQVFRLSFDARICFDEKMIEQRLDYIHYNPISGKWNLADNFVEYYHSSAAFYEDGTENEYVTHYKDVYVVGTASESLAGDSEGGNEVRKKKQKQIVEFDGLLASEFLAGDSEGGEETERGGEYIGLIGLPCPPDQNHTKWTLIIVYSKKKIIILLMSKFGYKLEPKNNPKLNATI